MAGILRSRRGARALPLSALLAGGLLAHRAFVPAPAGTRVTQQVGDAAELPQLLPGAAATVTLAALAAVDPAVAAGDSPLAHGTIGDIETGVLQGIFEKMVFGGLLVSTIAAWWRGTLGGAAEPQQDGKPAAFWGMSWSCASLVLLLSTRWYESGHFPLSNMYESLMFLAWGVTAVTIYFASMEEPRVSLGGEKKETSLSDLAAVWASPLALGIVAFATLTLPRELQKASALVPALQSNWLVMHVSVVMLSYATLLFGSVLCMGVLALSQPKDSPITKLREAIVPAFRGIADGLGPSPQPVVATSPPMPAQAMNMSEDLEKKEATTPVVQMVGSGGAVSVEFSQSGAMAAKLSDEDQLGITLDDLAYRSILLGFGFLTVGIISGAVWANEAWGNYWSWDPKETWALICWLVYAVYLHTRLQLGWDTRDSAKIGAFGFFIVWLCYIGVNLMGVGLHSYGFFLK